MEILSAFVGLTFCFSQFLHFLFSYILINSDASSSIYNLNLLSLFICWQILGTVSYGFIYFSAVNFSQSL